MYLKHNQLPIWFPILLGLLGLVGVVGGVAELLAESTRGSKGPSLRSPSGIAYADGRIFVLEGTEWIRVYSEDGDELDSWRVYTGQGLALLETTEEGFVRVRSIRTRESVIYNRNGDVISESPDPHVSQDVRGMPYSCAARRANEAYVVFENGVYLRDRSGSLTEIVPPGYQFVAPPPLAIGIGATWCVMGFVFAGALQSSRAAA